MNSPEIYVCILGGIFTSLLLSGSYRIVGQTVARLEIPLKKHLIYPPVVRGWRGLGRWTRLALMRRGLYVAVNLFFLLFRHTTIESVSRMAGVLAGINMVPLYFGSHHGAMADLLGLSLSTFRSLHAEIALMTISMSAVHTMIMLLKGPTFAWSNTVHLHGVFVRLPGSLSSLRLLMTNRQCSHSCVCSSSPFQSFDASFMRCRSGFISYCLWRLLMR